MSAEWSEIRTRDGAEIAEALNRITEHRARLTVEEPERLELHVRTGRRDDVVATRMRLGGIRYAADAEPVTDLLAGCVVEGGGAFRTRRDEVTLGPADGWICPTGVPISAEHGRATMHVVRLPLAYAAEIAEAETGLPAADLRFEAVRPVSEALRLHWASTAAYVSEQLTHQGEIPPLIAGQLRRLAAAAMLATFPNTAMTAGPVREHHVPPAAVRRAKALMDDHPERPLTIADLTAAAGVGGRALQGAFRRHLGTTPMGYLRRVRLERAHRDLQAATPDGTVTVREIARRWGFANPSRFATDYRAAFGRLPSRTLRI